MLVTAKNNSDSRTYRTVGFTARLDFARRHHGSAPTDRECVIGSLPG
jgi:hypothetical protein